MIRQHLHLDRYGWTAEMFYAVRCYHTAEIVSRMRRLDIRETDISRAADNMDCGRFNGGLTFTNYPLRRSVMVVGITSTPAQFLNTLVHEIHHLTAHICEASGIDPTSEEAATLAGDIAEQTYEKVNPLLCEHCRAHQHI